MEDIGIVIVKIVSLIFLIIFVVIAVILCHKGLKKVVTWSGRPGEHEAFEDKGEGVDLDGDASGADS